MNGLVIAGGDSVRMEQNKAEIIYHQLPQYQHVYNLISEFCETTYISVKEYKQYNLPLLVDNPIYNNIGPLAAILSALEHSVTDWLIIAVDYPLLTREDIQKLVNSYIDTQSSTAFYNSQTKLYEPYLAVYTTDFSKLLNSYYKQKKYSLQKILQQSNIQKITPTQIENIISIDTPEDYQYIINKLK